MMNLKNPQRDWISLGVCLAACAGLNVLLVGCGSKPVEEVAVAPPTPAPPPAPEAPRVTPIDQMMVELNIDPRVRLPEAKAPETNEDRKAVLEFFDAFARGDANAVKSMLPEIDQRELAPLVASGAWKDSVSQIKSVEVQTGRNANGQKCALALIETVKGAVSNFQPQLWYYTVENNQNLFEAAPTPPGIVDRLSGSDWIGQWHKILADELALADKPEEEFDPPKKVLDKGGSSSGSNSPAPPPSSGGARGLRPGAKPAPAPGTGGGGESPGGGRPPRGAGGS